MESDADYSYGYYSYQVNKWACEGHVTVKRAIDRNDWQDDNSSPDSYSEDKDFAQVYFSRSSHKWVVFVMIHCFFT